MNARTGLAALAVIGMIASGAIAPTPAKALEYSWDEWGGWRHCVHFNSGAVNCWWKLYQSPTAPGASGGPLAKPDAATVRRIEAMRAESPEATVARAGAEGRAKAGPAKEAKSR